MINKGITLRGAGKGATILSRSDGAHFEPGACSGPSPTPLIAVGPQYGGMWPGNPDVTNTNSSNLTADAVAGASSITVASSAAFSVGQIVLLDELSGAGWQPEVTGTNTSTWASPDYRVVWRKRKSDLTTTSPTAAGNNVLHFASVSPGIIAPYNIPVRDITTPANIPSGTVANAVTSTTVTMSNNSGPGVPPGDVIEFPLNYQDDFLVDVFPYQPGTFGDAFSRLDRVTTEIKEIASISGNTITFTSPISISYRTSHTAQLSWYSDANTGTYIPHTQGAGIESLSMVGADAGSLSFLWAAYSWAKDIEVSMYCGTGVNFFASFRIEMREFYLHDAAWVKTGGGAYQIGLNQGSSEILIENGISVRANKVMVARAAGTGSVIGYNYMDMQNISGGTPNADWIEIGLNASHFNGPHHVLFEGNYGANADSDVTHGASDYITYFRNHLRGIRHSFVDTENGTTIDDASQPGNGPKRVAGNASYSYWFSFIGNVLGASGQMSGWSYACTVNWGSCAPGIWWLGWGDQNPDPQEVDPTFPGHAIRDGNWDWVTSSQKWENTPATFPIPNSMYLTSKPAFFGSNPWPWVDPTTGAIYTLPAKARYDTNRPKS